MQTLISTEKHHTFGSLTHMLISPYVTYLPDRYGIFLYIIVCCSMLLYVVCCLYFLAVLIQKTLLVHENQRLVLQALRHQPVVEEKLLAQTWV